MTDQNQVQEFAGLTRHSDADNEIIPDEPWGHGSSMRWWAAEKRGKEQPSELPGTGLNQIIDQLPRATQVTAGWKNPISGEWVETEKHNAIANPTRVEDLVLDDLDDADEALYYIPSSDYEIINPSTSLRPLAETLQDEGYGDDVFGEFRLYRGGGQVSADILLDGKHVDHPDMDADRKPIVVGMEVQYDFFGDTAFRIRGIAMDYECVNALRGVTDWESVRHTGDMERVDWNELYEELLEELDLKVDQLSQIIQEANEMELDIGELPEDFAQDHDSLLEAFYNYAGFPGYLANAAAQNVRAEATDPFNPTWWELHRGATYAITHEARGTLNGQAIEEYNRLANDILMQPNVFEDDVQQEYERVVAEREDDELSDVGGGTVEIQEAFQSVRDKKDEFEERADELRELATQ